MIQAKEIIPFFLCAFYVTVISQSGFQNKFLLLEINEYTD